jgi:protein-arginine kinase activator protein McsA
MLCPNCQVEFSSTTNIPRILIFCGHTFCQACIENLIQTVEKEGEKEKPAFECPECGTVNIANDGINSFPKNLVLL